MSVLNVLFLLICSFRKHGNSMRCVDVVYTIVKLQFSVIEENKVGSTAVGGCKHAVCRIDKAARCPQPGPTITLLHYCAKNMGLLTTTLLHYCTHERPTSSLHPCWA